MMEVVNEYAHWIAGLNKYYGHKLFFLNIPTPAYSNKFVQAKYNKFVGLIDLFTGRLLAHPHKLGCNLIDVHKLTGNVFRFSYLKYQIDNRHLGQNIMKSCING